MTFRFPRDSTASFNEGAISALVDDRDWGKTALGPRETWPASLGTALGICLGASTPIAILWGRDLVLLYNDAWARLLGGRHPAAFGVPARDALGDCWDSVAAIVERTVATGEATRVRDRIAPSLEDGTQRYDHDLNPIPADDGSVAGIFLVSNETTTRRAEASIDLDETERRFREMIDALPAPIYTTDAEGRVTYFNPAAVELAGRVPELGNDRWSILWKLFHPDGTPMPHGSCPMAVALEEDRIIGGVEAMAERPDGQRVWFRTYATPLHDASGKLAGGINMLVDVTESRRTELLLREQKRVLELIASGRSVDECLSALCDSVRRLEPRGRAVVELVDDHRSEVEPRSAAHEHDSERCFGAPVLGPDGATLATFYLCLDEARTTDGWEQILSAFATRVAGIALEHHRRGTALRESEDQFRSLFESIDQAFCVLEKVATRPGRRSDYVAIVANPAFERQTGLEGVIDRRMLDVLPDMEDYWVDALDRVLETGEPVSFENRMEPLDRIFDCHLFPTGRPGQNRVAALFNDVTEHHRAAAALEEADRAKDEFLAMLGHELRNPLSPMVTALELMRLRGPDLLVKERTVIERQVHRVVSLVDDLLDVSRITRGKVELETTPIDIAEVVAEAIETVDPLLQQREQAICTSVDPGLLVAGDARRLIQILVNLLTNAAKYSPPRRRIDILAHAEGDDMVLAVRDQGIGIEPSLLPQVFELFSQSSQRIDRAEGGLGLGLAIVKNLVTLHGGEVTAHSEGRDKGSEFVVRLPLCSRPSSHAPAAGPRLTLTEDAEKAADRHKVLIVDDNVDAADSLADLLDAVGYNTRIAHDGSEALDAAADFLPDVALVDIGLPVIDGYEVARRLRKEPELEHLGLIAVTGYGQRSDRQRALDAGFQEHVVKPVDATRLSELVERFVPHHGGRLPR